MKITVVGAGYVGIANAVLLAQHNAVTVLDIRQDRVDKINRRKSTVEDPHLQSFLSERPLTLQATTSKQQAYQGADLVIVATPTDYDPQSNHFDTASVESVVTEAVETNPGAGIVIKSTVPVGFTSALRAQSGQNSIVFSPEFLREGSALHDNLHPARIVVGDEGELGHTVASLLLQGAVDKDVPILICGSAEAEAIKLFANTYLAMRVAYFNELDSYAQTHELNSASIIRGVGLDPRIGLHYNNPSFGYGGYCLPKDTRQLLANYDQVPNNLIQAIVDANTTRKDFVANEILKREPGVVGIYRLVMKSGSDNYRSSAVQGVMRRLMDRGVVVVVYEPVMTQDSLFGSRRIADLGEFLAVSDVVVANRITDEIEVARHKIYTRDLFQDDRR